MADGQTIGAAFAAALAEKDRDALAGMLDAQIDFRGLTPNRLWEASDREQVLETLLGSWFEPSDQITALTKLETDAVADRERVGYRLAVSNDEGDFVVEQQAYLSATDGRIEWMRVVCSGFRPGAG